MSFLSLRKLPKNLEKALLKEARIKKTTKTEVVLRALEDRFGLSRQEKRRQKLGQFFGHMTKRQYECFKKATEDFSKIDEELWK